MFLDPNSEWLSRFLHPRHVESTIQDLHSVCSVPIATRQSVEIKNRLLTNIFGIRILLMFQFNIEFVVYGADFNSQPKPVLTLRKDERLSE